MSTLLLIILLTGAVAAIIMMFHKPSAHHYELQLCNEIRNKLSTPSTDDIVNYDSMSGVDFEKFCADLLPYDGYSDIRTTPKSNDYGADIIAKKDGVSYAIQCKRYGNNIGVEAVQEAISGKIYYKCDKSAVLTNKYFTANAKDLASKSDVMLWDRNELEKLIRKKHKGQSIDGAAEIVGLYSRLLHYAYHMDLSISHFWSNTDRLRIEMSLNGSDAANLGDKGILLRMDRLIGASHKISKNNTAHSLVVSSRIPHDCLNDLWQVAFDENVDFKEWVFPAAVVFKKNLIDKYDKKYARIAIDMSTRLGKSVFYNIKTANGKSIYFTLPIEDEDITDVNRRFENCYIGIVYKR